MDAFEQPALLAAQAKALARLVQRLHAREQPWMHVDGALVRGQRLGHGALHGLQLRRGLRGAEVLEQRLQPRQALAAAIERGDGVVEAGRLRQRSQCLELGTMLLHRPDKRGFEMLGAHLREGRQAVRSGPGLQQRVGGGSAGLRK